MSIIYSICCLALCGIFKTVLCSFRETEDGGVGRLREKYPNLVKRTHFYEERWDLMTATLSLLVVVAQIASVALLMLAAISLELTAWSIILLLAGLTILQLLLVEILPDMLAERLSDRLSVAALPFAIAASFLLMFVLVPLRALTEWLDRHLLERVGVRNRPTAEEEIISLVEQADAEDMDLHEKQFIRSVFEFDETDVHEIMTPRIEIEAVEDNETVATCAARVREVPHSRFPVYHESLDDIVGIVHVKDLMRSLCEGGGETPVGNIAGAASFVPESMKIASLFQLIKRRRAHLAIVVDEYGGTAGVVALEDVIEELIGDIQDESDRETLGISKVSEGIWLVRARESVSDVNEATGLSIPESEQYDSVGGYIFQKLDRVPVAGEKLEGDGFEVVVQKASERQIQSVRISRSKARQRF